MIDKRVTVKDGKVRIDKQVLLAAESDRLAKWHGLKDTQELIAAIAKQKE